MTAESLQPSASWSWAHDATGSNVRQSATGRIDFICFSPRGILALISEVQRIAKILQGPIVEKRGRPSRCREADAPKDLGFFRRRAGAEFGIAQERSETRFFGARPVLCQLAT